GATPAGRTPRRAASPAPGGIGSSPWPGNWWMARPVSPRPTRSDRLSPRPLAIWAPFSRGAPQKGEETGHGRRHKRSHHLGGVASPAALHREPTGPGAHPGLGPQPPQPAPDPPARRGPQPPPGTG